MSYKNKIEEIRKKRGLTQKALADIIATTTPSISRYEKEDSRLTLPLLDRISRALECSIPELIGIQELSTHNMHESETAPYMLKESLLESAIEVIEEYATANKINLSASNKAKAVSALYEMAMLDEEEEVNASQAKTILKLVANG